MTFAGRILSIDPGSERSAWLVYESDKVVDHAISPNSDLLTLLRRAIDRTSFLRPSTIVIEWIESYGMPVGREVFETVWWAGRFTEAAQPTPVVQLPRRDVKLHLCGSPRAKDVNVRQALLDRFGGKSAKGTMAKPGPLYGIANDAWSALAIAVTYADNPVRGSA
jgi:hypothetical protein